MSDQVGAMRFGDVSIPAVFHGTARLMRPGETTSPSRTPRHDDLEGAFQGAFDPDFALLVSVGYVPVDPSHPAYPLYLAASTAPASPAPTAPARGLDPDHPDTVTMPFETVVTIPAEHALRFGLVAPGSPTGGGATGTEPARPMRRTPVPPPIFPGAGTRADRRDPPPLVGDFDAFLAFMGDPGRHPLPTPSDAASSRPSGQGRLDQQDAVAGILDDVGSLQPAVDRKAVTPAAPRGGSGQAPQTTDMGRTRLSARFETFFDRMYPEALKVANAFCIPVQWVLGLAAYESGYLGQHSLDTNNPWGLTAAGGNNLTFSSLSAATADFMREEGWRFSTPPRTIDEFADDLGKSPAFNSVNSDYKQMLGSIIQSTSARLNVWLAEHLQTGL